MKRKPIFDVIRLLLARALRQREVLQIDAAIDAAIDATLAASGARPGAIGAEGVALIKRFEGCAKPRADGRFEAYPDPGSGGTPWTIGWGATGAGIEPGTVWTQAQCDARLEADLIRYAEDVTAALAGAPTTQHQFDALVSFHYNTGAIARATLTRRHKAGDFAGAAAEFARWNRAGGQVLNGLMRRRAAEAQLYLNGKQRGPESEPGPAHDVGTTEQEINKCCV